MISVAFRDPRRLPVPALKTAVLGLLVPAIVVSVSLTLFCAMRLRGFSLNNLLMALTIATGFVVDDAIVVMENIHRHIEQGVAPFRAALLGVRAGRPSRCCR